MQIVRAKYSSAAAFLAAYQAQFSCGGLFVPSRNHPPLGAQIVLDVRFPPLRSKVLVRGTVSWRRVGSRQRTKLRPGIGVEFHGDERRKRDFLLAVARGDVVDLVQRRHRRLPVELAVSWRPKELRASYESQLDDIGEGGAFIRTTEFMPVGSSVILEITAPGSSAAVELEARVAWTEHTPGGEGMGVEFRCRDAGGTRRLRELVRRFAEAGKRSADTA